MKTIFSPLVLVGALTAALGAGCITKEVPASSDCDAGCQVDATPMACSMMGPDPACDVTQPVCNGSTCGACRTSADCMDRGAADLCTPSGACGECAETDAQDMVNCPTAGTDVCDGASHTCRACAVDSECASGWCEQGSCIAAADIAYVKPSGTASAPCPQVPGCATLAIAVATDRAKILVAPGAYDSNTMATDINNRNVTIKAAGATFSRSNNGSILTLSGSSVVTIVGGNFDAAGDGNADAAIDTKGGTTLTLRSVTVQNSQQHGINADGNLTVQDSRIINNTTDGVAFNGNSKDLEISRSEVSGNGRSGIRLDARTALIVGTMVTKNGTQTQAPALYMLGLTSPGGSRFEFNTVAANGANNVAGAGITCVGMPVVKNSIIWGNSGSPQVVGCMLRSSSVQGMADAPNDVIDEDPQFMSTTDYHLTPTSPMAARSDTMSPAVPANVDIDGDARPDTAGAPADLGADEIP